MKRYKTNYKPHYNSYYNPHTYNSYSDELKSYVKNEFFNSNTDVFTNIVEFYRGKYGKKAFDYLIDTFHLWKNGVRKISDQTMDRILLCVPKFLPKEKQIFILKQEILLFIEKEQRTYQNKKVDFYNIESIYRDFFSKVESLDTNSLRWFVKDVFSTAELNDFIEIFKYVILMKIEKSYSDLERDFSLILPFINKIKVGIVNLSYKVDFFKFDIELQPDLKNFLDLMVFTIHKPKMNKHIDEKMLVILLKDILEIQFLNDVRTIDFEISKSDLDLFSSQYKSIIANERSAEMKSSLKGKGGMLSIHLNVISKSYLKKSLLFNIFLLLLFILSLSLTVYCIFKYKLYENGFFIILLFGVLIIYLVTSTKVLISRIIKLKNGILEYARR